MSSTWKTVRVFISSTFRDMQAERDWLVKRVFPALRQRLEPHRIHLVDIDLRWGITRQQADNDQVLGLCLQQIDECHPFFLGLLGGRYGWVPSKFPAEVGTRYGLTQAHTGKSVTELEILHGVLNDPAMHGRALFCFRADSFLHAIKEKEKRRVYVEVPTRDELNELGWRKAKQRSQGHRQQLEELKKRIRSLSPPMPLFDGYPCQWNPTLPDPVSKTPGRLDGLKEFGNWVIEKLEQAILHAPELQEHLAGTRAATRDELAEERDFHKQFIENRTRIYIGRQRLQDELKAFITGSETKPCLVTGPSGSGKSAALAKFCQTFQNEISSGLHPSSFIIQHFAGASPRSTSLREMLRRLCAELKDTLKLEDEIKQEIRELSDQFREFLAKVPEKLPKGHRVLLVLDALNQLDETDNAHSLYWLPTQIPPAVRLMVSCIDDPDRPDQPALAAMRRHTPHEIKVGLLTDDERLGIVREIPSVAAKTLDEAQVRLLLDNEATRNPLFLLVALEELRGFGSFEELNRKIAALPQTGDTLTAIFQQVIRRLGEDFNAVTVKEVLTLLACSRRGLSERELLDLLEGGHVRIEESAGDLFPILRQLRPYLQSRSPLLGFYHRHLAKATDQEFFNSNDNQRLAGHQRLAEYFHGQDYFFESLEAQRERAMRLPPTPRPANVRKVDELPWQRLEAARHSEKWTEIEKLFTDLFFLEAKAEGRMIFELVGDLAAAAVLLPKARRHHDVFQSFQKALAFDAEFLNRHPTTLLQCLWNTCWWHDCPEAAANYDVTKLPDKASPPSWLREIWQEHFRGPPRMHVFPPRWERNTFSLHQLLNAWKTTKESITPQFLWLRSLRPPEASLESSVLQVFRGHSKPISGLEVSSGQALAASCSEDPSIRIWDLCSDRGLFLFPASRHVPLCVAFLPKSQLIVVGHDAHDNDPNLTLWDANRGEQLATMHFGRFPIRSIAVNESGCQICLGLDNGEFHFVDSTSWKVVCVIKKGAHSTNACQYSHDGTGIVTASDFKASTLTRWDIRTWANIFTAQGHGNTINAIAMSADGTLVASASSDYTIKLWNADTGQLVRCLLGHTFGVCCVAISADNKLAASGSSDRTVRIWEISTGATLVIHRPHDDRVTHINFLGSGERFISASEDGTVCVCSTFFDRPHFNLIGHKSLDETWGRQVGYAQVIQCVGFSPDGRHVATGSLDGTARLWDVARRIPLGSLEGHTGWVTSVAFSFNGTQLATSSFDGMVRVWNISKFEVQHCCQGHTKRVDVVTFSPVGSVIASGSLDKTVCLWNSQTGNQMAVLRGHEWGVACLAFSSDGRWLASGGALYDHSIRILDIATGEEILYLSDLRCVLVELRFSADNTRLACVFVDLPGDCTMVDSYRLNKRVVVWSVPTGECVSTTEGNESVAALLDGVEKYPWRAERRAAEIVVESGQEDEPAASFAATPFKVAVSPSGRAWAAIYRNHLSVIELEGKLE
ncbi:MAG TPA: DUF4062 domain-containing protein [Planctomycetaceae bacterium]|nr:DUF4062 domain-containing protein [Planctomycetaceae bacterium]